jgi:hypothetical protein
MACVLGPALARKASHGGTANNARMAAHKSAGLRRGGRLPQASVSPAKRRATRARRRRRLHCRRQRAAWLPHGQHTKSPDHLPASGQKSADNANRHGGAERLAEPAGPQSSAVDRALRGHDDAGRRASALSGLTAPQEPDAHARSRRRPVPGIGASLRLGLL